MEAVWRTPVIEFLGMTEAGQQIASNPLPPRPRKPGSVGLPAGAEVMILSEDGLPLPAGRAGEIAIRGESVTRGYDRNPEENRKAFQGGWLRTGDEGCFDSDGYLFVTGRRKEMINRGGEKVSPREVEEALLELPSIEQAVVFSVPDRRLGEEVGAAVVLRRGARGDEAQIRRFASTRLAAFKVPSVVRMVAELPMGPAGKPLRIGLAAALGISAIDDARPGGTPGHVPPRNDLERELAEMWCELLAVESPGVHDSFLALGGDSLMAARFLSRVRGRFGFELAPVAFFENPTIASVAGALAGAG
jgi:acyl-coenzyme A synthetase/AMP-(fatty) acid ligase